MSGIGPVVHLDEQHWKQSHDVFLECLHLPPSSAERWEQVRGLYRKGLVYGVLDGDVVAGTLMTTPLEVVVPGGRAVPLAGSTAAGVRSGYLRQGLFADMMTARLDDLADSDVVLMAERPSAATLYPRWGSGPATFTQTVRVLRDRTGPRPDLPRAPDVTRVPVDDGLRARLAAIGDAAAAASGARPGTVVRSDAWWDSWDPYGDPPGTLAAATYEAPDGTPGYVSWYVDFEGADVASMRRVLTVVELVAGSAEVAAALWRHLLRLDLVEEIRAPGRPVDEAVALLLDDRRACQVGDVLDELWLRIIDVPAALAARRWSGRGDDSVVVEVHDPHIARNNGCYRIGAGGAERVSAGPDLTLPVASLAMAYLGGTRPSQLAAAGLVQTHDSAALAAADRLFAADAAPWCGTMF